MVVSLYSNELGLRLVNLTANHGIREAGKVRLTTVLGSIACDLMELLTLRPSNF